MSTRSPQSSEVSEEQPRQSVDDELISAARAGDPDAFSLLLDRHIRAIRTYLALRVPAAHLVDELAQDTFIFAHQRLDQFTLGTSFPAWLHAIAWNHLRAEVQRFARERVKLDRLVAWQVEELSVSPDDLLPTVEAEHLMNCLQELPQTLLELVTLKYREDQSTKDIAARLQRSIAWVRVSLFRVRQQLRDCISRGMPTKPC